MKNGYLWGDDEENMELQARTKRLVQQFNALPPEDMDGRAALLPEIFGDVGENVWIVPPFSAAVGKYVSIGAGIYANMNLTLIDDWKITIGKNVLNSFPITIKDNVWLGANVIVLPGVTIGENSVIGAGSVVTKDIPANVVAFGVPCKVYREINERDAEYYFRDRRFDEQPED